MNKAKLRKIIELFEPHRENIRIMNDLDKFLTERKEDTRSVRNHLEELMSISYSVQLKDLIVVLYDLPKDNSVNYMDGMREGLDPNADYYSGMVCHDYLTDCVVQWEESRITTDKLLDEIIEYVLDFKVNENE
jgi:hypothetical protein